MCMPRVYWLTGLSGAGKTTIAEHLYQTLREDFPKVCLLDGDVLRKGLCQDLGFDMPSRQENMRRVGELTKLFLAMGIPVIAAFISPTRDGRDSVRRLLPEGGFVEVHVATPLAVCEQRDVKGLYKKARSGEIAFFTGISSAYEQPLNPEVYVDTSTMDVAACVQRIIDMPVKFV